MAKAKAKGSALSFFALTEFDSICGPVVAGKKCVDPTLEHPLMGTDDYSLFTDPEDRRHTAQSTASMTLKCDDELEEKEDPKASWSSMSWLLLSGAPRTKSSAITTSSRDPNSQLSVSCRLTIEAPAPSALHSLSNLC